VRSALASQGIEPPHHLNPVLYRLANDPAFASLVFRDVTSGNNEVFNTTCCVAGPGYDLTTGLGQLDFAQLALALALDARPPAPVTGPRFTG
jgi:hypothetical protein